MAESAGALLLRAGLISPDQLLAAHAARQQQGGTLGYHLVRLGMVDEERLADFYRHRLMVPRIERTALEHISRQIIERVPRDMAAEFRVVPLELDRDGNLTVVMSDPADTHAVDEVAFFTSLYVMRAVAIESDIEWALAKYYGVLHALPPPPPELGPAREKRPTYPYGVEPDAGPPAPYEPEPAPIVLTQPKPAPAQAAEPPYASEPPVVVLDPAPSPPPAPPPPPAADPRAARSHDRPIMLRLLDIVDQLRAAQSRDAVANAMLDFLDSIYTRCAFFVARKGSLSALAARGPFPEGLRTLAIPIEPPSLLHDVIADCAPYRGPLPRGPLNARLALALGGWPGEIILAPVRIRERVVGVLYVDGPKQSVPEEVLEKLAVEAGAAYERILLAAKPAPSPRP